MRFNVRKKNHLYIIFIPHSLKVQLLLLYRIIYLADDDDW